MEEDVGFQFEQEVEQVLEEKAPMSSARSKFQLHLDDGDQSIDEEEEEEEEEKEEYFDEDISLMKQYPEEDAVDYDPRLGSDVEYSDDDFDDEDFESEADDEDEEEEEESARKKDEPRVSQFELNLARQRRRITTKPRYSVEFVRMGDDSEFGKASSKRTTLNEDFVELFVVLIIWVIFVFLIFRFTSWTEEIRQLVTFVMSLLFIPFAGYLILHFYEIKTRASIESTAAKVLTK